MNWFQMVLLYKLLISKTVNNLVKQSLGWLYKYLNVYQTICIK
jgi:hypothetical protein